MKRQIYAKVLQRGSKNLLFDEILKAPFHRALCYFCNSLPVPRAWLSKIVL